jgi:hypothetical protein
MKAACEFLLSKTVEKRKPSTVGETRKKGRKERRLSREEKDIHVVVQ